LFPWNKVIISVPYHSEKQIIAETNQILQSWKEIKIIEIRFDYWIGDLVDDAVARIARYLRKSHLKSIFTYQSQPHDDESTLVPLYQRLIQYNPDYIDFDTNLQASVLDGLASLATQKRTNIIYSYHNWKETPPRESISSLYELFIQRLPYLSSNERNVLKLVFMATKTTDVNKILDFCRQYSHHGIKLISFCMGELGKVSRILSILNGCAFTYAHIGEATAPGQIHISEISIYLRNNPLS